jgi:two-component system phosphate regulon sensor histidine kinase PhoR
VWFPTLYALAATAALALTAAWWGGQWVGIAVAGLGMLAIIARHVRNLARLRDWLEDVQEVPRGSGEWAPVFEGLERRLRDLRDRHDKLVASLERFRAASQAMPDGVIYLADDGRIEWINEKAEQHFGLNHLSDVGHSLVGLVRHPELLRYLEAGPPDEPLVIPSPRRPSTRLMIQRVPFAEDRQMLVSRDITQIEKLETMRRDFIANVSHELRTPLTVVGGFVETVMDGLDDLPREDILRYLNLALEQSVRMQRLIEDLLALSALETGAPAPREERVRVLDLVRKIHQEAELLSAGRHEVSLSIDERDEGDQVLGSQKELHSAFANLASNAVRYTPGGGYIRIGWRHTGKGAEFSVEDNGIGIEAEHINRLTERFFRVDRGRSRETGGTGLGLAIVKHIISRHRAELLIDSEAGRGSRFSVVFPASRLRH